MTIFVDSSPLYGGHAVRGIGTYTRQLLAALDRQPDIEVISSLNSLSQSKIDLVHYPFFDLFAPSLPIFRPHPTVITIHDVIPLQFPQHYQPGVKGKLYWQRQKMLARGVAAIITDSHASKAQIVSHLRVKPDRVHVVYLAANPQLSPQPSARVAKVRRTHRLPKHYCLYVGDINYNKNLPQLVKAVKYWPEKIHLICVGKNFRPQPIPEWLAIEQQLALSDVANRVHFVTDVKSDDEVSLSALYSGAIAHIQPSLAEGFGLPVLEAMRCRTVSIAAANSSLLEIANQFSLLAEPTAEDIADQVRVVSNWGIRQRQAWTAKARQWSNNFSWQSAAAETVAVYQQVLGQ